MSSKSGERYLVLVQFAEDPLISQGRQPPPQLAIFSTTMPSIGGSSTGFPSSSSLYTEQQFTQRFKYCVEQLRGQRKVVYSS